MNRFKPDIVISNTARRTSAKLFNHKNLYDAWDSVVKGIVLKILSEKSNHIKIERFYVFVSIFTIV